MNGQIPPQNMNYVVLPSSTLATVSLVAGILGFVALPVIGSIVALWAGYSARKETRAVPPVAAGDGMATAGIIMGWIQIGLMVVGICCAIAYFGFFAAIFASSINQ
jgi:hypothetical protein